MADHLPVLGFAVVRQGRDHPLASASISSKAWRLSA